MQKYGFVYIWYDSARSKQNGPDKIKRYYIGRHWGTEDDGYICSSKWMREALQRRPQDFQPRHILRTKIPTKEETVQEELHWLQMIKKEELGKKYYNFINYKFGVIEHSQNTKNKISKSSKGKHNSISTEFKIGNKGFWKGKHLSQEIKDKIIESRKWYKHSDKTKEKMRNKIVSEESREKIRKYQKGRIKTQETKDKISESHSIKEYIIIDSQGNEFEINNLSRWCKDNKISRTCLKLILKKEKETCKGYKIRYREK